MGHDALDIGIKHDCSSYYMVRKLSELDVSLIKLSKENISPEKKKSLKMDNVVRSLGLNMSSVARPEKDVFF